MDGSISKGAPIQGVTISFKGANSVVSSLNGSFSLRVSDNVFYLENVVKNGYRLVDADILLKQYSYSSNPLVIVMESPSDQIEDLLIIERRIRRSLQRQLAEKEKEIDALKESNRISTEEYCSQLQKLYSDSENNESLIRKMAEHYSKIDFDQLDDFNATISTLIIDGELAKADSLLNSKGSITSRLRSLSRLRKENADFRQQLEKSEKLAHRQMIDIAQDCYSKFEISQLRYQMDSARYYIELRTSLDSTNIVWQSSASLFLSDLGCFKEALDYSLKAFNNAQAMYGESSMEVAECMKNIGKNYYSLDKLDVALNYFEKALSIMEDSGNNDSSIAADTYIGIGKVLWETDFNKGIDNILHASRILCKLYGEESLEVEYTYRLLGSMLNTKGEYEESLTYYDKASKIIQKNRGDMHPSLATVYQGIGRVLCSQGDYSGALQQYQKAELIFKTVFGDSFFDLANCYSDIGEAYRELGSFDKALEYQFKALEIKKRYRGEKSMNIASSYEKIGNAYSSIGAYAAAVEYYLKCLQIQEALQGEGYSYSKAIVHNNIGVAYGEMEDYDKAIMHYTESLRTFIGLFGEINSNVAKCYNNIGTIYGRKGMNDEALKYYQKAYEVNVGLLGQEHPSIAYCFNNFGTVYYESGEYELAKENFEKAKRVFLLFIDKDHPVISIIEENIEACKNKMGTNRQN